MTTLRIEVGRHCGTTVEDVVAGLERAGCMKYLEIDPDAHEHLPIEELTMALEGAGFQVVLRPEPPPPPLPWWRRVRGWPHRVYYWGRRVFLGEKEIDQFVRELEKAYASTDAIHAMATRESPMMKLIRRPEEGLDTDRIQEAFDPFACPGCGARDGAQHRAGCPGWPGFP